MCKHPRLNLNAIRDTLTAFDTSKVKAGSLDDDRTIRLVAAYDLLDKLLASGMNLLSYGSSKAILELNHTILYGSDANCAGIDRRALDASEERFYNGDETSIVQGVNGGIADLMDWSESHRWLGVYERAAGVMIRTLASPQLFVEGNHRTSALLASHELLLAKKPPLVFSSEHASASIDGIKPIAELSRGSLSIWIQERRLRPRLGQLIARSISEKHLMS